MITKYFIQAAHLLKENKLISIISIIGTALAISMIMVIVLRVWQMEWGMARFIPGILITFFLMVIMIVAGISYPARQATKVEPAEALHEE